MLIRGEGEYLLIHLAIAHSYPAFGLFHCLCLRVVVFDEIQMQLHIPHAAVVIVPVHEPLRLQETNETLPLFVAIVVCRVTPDNAVRSMVRFLADLADLVVSCGLFLGIVTLRYDRHPYFRYNQSTSCI